MCVVERGPRGGDKKEGKEEKDVEMSCGKRRGRGGALRRSQGSC